MPRCGLSWFGNANHSEMRKGVIFHGNEKVYWSFEVNWRSCCFSRPQIKYQPNRSSSHSQDSCWRLCASQIIFEGEKGIIRGWIHPSDIRWPNCERQIVFTGSNLHCFGNDFVSFSKVHWGKGIYWKKYAILGRIGQQIQIPSIR